MRMKKLKALFSVLAATLVITGINYTIDNNIKVVYGTEAESQAESNIKFEITYNNADSANSIDPVITITNNSDKELNLKDLNLKYFGPYGEGNDVCACYYAGTNNGNYKNFTDNVEGDIREDSEDFDKHLNIKFNDGVLDVGQSMSMQMSVHKNDWSNYEESDKSAFSLSVYEDGNLIYGEDMSKDKVDVTESLKMSIGDEKVESWDGRDHYVPVFMESKEIASLTAEVKYDPNQVEFNYINSKKKVKFEDDSENGIIKITYTPGDGEIISSEEMEKLCDIHFKDLNGIIGSESEISVSGTYSLTSNPEEILEIESENIGKIVYKGDENLDWSMPILGNDSVSVIRGYESKGLKLKVEENGHKFLGIKGLEEGKDYTWKNNFINFSEDILKEFNKDYEKTVYLNFEDNITKAFTTLSSGIDTCDDKLYCNRERVTINQGDFIFYNLEIKGARFPSQGEFNLTYDNDTFDDVLVINGSNNKNLKYEVDKENGIIHLSYENLDSSIANEPLKLKLLLFQKYNRKIGDTRIGVENIPGNNLKISSGNLGDLGLIKINKKVVMPQVSIVNEPKTSHYSMDSIKVIENGNKFLGLEGLEEGKDYTCKRVKGKMSYEDYISINKKEIYERHSYKDCGSGECERYMDFYLNFENNIRQVAAITNEQMPGIDYFELQMGGTTGKRGEYIKVPIELHPFEDDVIFNGFEFILEYDTDIFEDAYVDEDESSYIKLKYVDKENGIIKISYFPSEPLTLSRRNILDNINLMLKVKDNALIGSTMISVKGAYAKATDKSEDRYYDAIHSGAESRELINIME